MKSNLLNVVAVVANPIRWQSRISLYRLFEQHMLDSGVNLTTVECAYGDRPFELAGSPHVQHVGVRARTLVWNKESLINTGIARLPADWKYVAWIDADITFRKPEWAAETVQALQQYSVVQPWSDCYDLGPDDDHLQAHRSFCRMFHDRQPIVPSGYGGYQFAHPGYAWAATRGALEQLGGLLDTAALGAGDHHMALALIGRAEESLPGGISASYRAAVMRWQARAAQHINRNIGYVPGTIEHAWHGSKDKRAYVSRWDILIRNKFDPIEDLKANVWGVTELAGNKPELAHDIDLYMRSRAEDANAI
jgi:hypothetical protein